jgi:hypothetical protein
VAAAWVRSAAPAYVRAAASEAPAARATAAPVPTWPSWARPAARLSRDWTSRVMACARASRRRLRRANVGTPCARWRARECSSATRLAVSPTMASRPAAMPRSPPRSMVATPRLATGKSAWMWAATSAIAASMSAGNSGAQGSGTRDPAMAAPWLDARYARTASSPSPSVAVDALTRTPTSSRSSASRSTRTPRARASSSMFRSRQKGMPSSAIWSVSKSVRLRPFASPTWTSASCGSRRRMSRVTDSSSLIGTRLCVPGVSTTSHTWSPKRARPRVTSTVVPG